MFLEVFWEAVLVFGCLHFRFQDSRFVQVLLCVLRADLLISVWAFLSCLRIVFRGYCVVVNRPAI
jgi:hypothetical protein